jgi:hypothetical protein
LPPEVLEAESELHFPSLVEVFPERMQRQQQQQAVEQEEPIERGKKKKTVLLATGSRNYSRR